MCFVAVADIRECCVYGSVAEGGGRGAVSAGLWLFSMLTMMLCGDLDVATWF